MAAPLELTLGQLSALANRKAAEIERLSFRPPLEDSKLLIIGAVRQGFQQGMSPDGIPWAPLKFQRPYAGTSNKPLLNFGFLQASIVGAGRGHVEKLTDFELIMGTNLESAGLHQFGGTITPRRAKALTIPLTKEAARAGGARRFGRPLFVLQGNEGETAFLAEKVTKGKQQKLIRHYLLTKRVTVPARPFLGFGQQLVKEIDSTFTEYVEKQLGF